METEIIIRTVFLAWEKGIYVVGPTYVSEALEIPKSTAQKFLQRIADMGYGIYIPKKGFIFNEEGLKEGAKILRKHRLIECFLEEMGLKYDEICYEAACIESSIGDSFFRLIEEKYGNRKFCPCGNEIPEVK
jgi:DtxR family Mn-dependent transcriptional regulator